MPWYYLKVDSWGFQYIQLFDIQWALNNQIANLVWTKNDISSFDYTSWSGKKFINSSAVGGGRLAAALLLVELRWLLSERAAVVNVFWNSIVELFRTLPRIDGRNWISPRNEFNSFHHHQLPKRALNLHHQLTNFHLVFDEVCLLSIYSSGFFLSDIYAGQKCTYFAELIDDATYGLLITWEPSYKILGSHFLMFLVRIPCHNHRQTTSRRLPFDLQKQFVEVGKSW